MFGGDSVCPDRIHCFKKLIKFKAIKNGTIVLIIVPLYICEGLAPQSGPFVHA